MLVRGTGGLSPRMRGNPGPARPADIQMRSIPAHAGQPTAARAATAHARVYPRACGATRDIVVGRCIRCGLSPRMRGNRPRQIRPPALRRSIPAHAGQPTDCRQNHHGAGVYPRACGATRDARQIAVNHGGLSPRMRGNPASCAAIKRGSGSIPAHAGQPESAVSR